MNIFWNPLRNQSLTFSRKTSAVMDIVNSQNQALRGPYRTISHVWVNTPDKKGKGRIGGRLCPEAVARAFKAAAEYLELPAEEVEGISGHSVRVGATQDLLALNVDLASLMREGRWKSVRMPMRYGEHVMAAWGGMARAAREQGRDAE